MSKRRLLVAGVMSTAMLASTVNTVAAEESTTTVPAAAPASCATETPTSTTVAAAAAASTTTTAAPAPASTDKPVPAAGELDGSGATFPKVFYQEMMADFTEANPNVTITYAGGGSGTGRQQLADQVVQWAGTDSPIKDADLGKFKGGDVLYFPTVLAPITVSYNLDGVDTLKLTPTNIAKIFQGEIKNWNDPALATDNADVTLPDQPITIVRRVDSSGTTSNFTKFLDKSVGTGGDCTWKLGADSTVEWPADSQAGDGNSGVAQIVSSTPGAIGYVDLSDAVDAGLKYAEVQNKAGAFVAADLAGATAAGEGAKLNDNLTFSAVWAEGDTAYPITAQTWIIVYKKQSDAAVGDNLKAFLNYLLTDGQAKAAELNFAPLPLEILGKAVAQLDTLEIG